MTATRWCPGYTSDGSAGQQYSQARHEVDAEASANGGKGNFSPGKSQCRECYGQYARDWRAKRNVGSPSGTRARRTVSRPNIVIPDLRVPMGTGLDEIDGGDDDETVSDEDLKSGSHAYVPSAEMLEVWAATTAATAAGKPAGNIMFLGNKGVGKTEGAEFLASTVGLPYVKIDAASMTDPESWFGTREVIADPETGSSVTSYRPSAFALGIEQPCVMLIDEINRAKDTDRNILLPVLDKTRRVMNPLTGDVLRRHPRCFIIMSGNRGLAFTGTYAIDPAFMSRSRHVKFDYVDQVSEIQIARDATGCDEETATMFVAFAVATRARAKLDADFEPMSTREVIEACEMVAFGASLDTAARAVVINGASEEGGAASFSAQLDQIWTGVRKTPAGQPVTRPCGVKHPWETSDDGNPIACEVDVPIATLASAHGHLSSPQHKGNKTFADGTKREIGWMAQP